jgi:hypothetical protein
VTWGRGGREGGRAHLPPLRRLPAHHQRAPGRPVGCLHCCRCPLRPQPPVAWRRPSGTARAAGPWGKHRARRAHLAGLRLTAAAPLLPAPAAKQKEAEIAAAGEEYKNSMLREREELRRQRGMLAEDKPSGESDLQVGRVGRGCAAHAGWAGALWLLLCWASVAWLAAACLAGPLKLRGPCPAVRWTCKAGRGLYGSPRPQPAWPKQPEAAAAPKPAAPPWPCRWAAACTAPASSSRTAARRTSSAPQCARATSASSSPAARAAGYWRTTPAAGGGGRQRRPAPGRASAAGGGAGPVPRRVPVRRGLPTLVEMRVAEGARGWSQALLPWGCGGLRPLCGLAQQLACL